MAYKVKYKEEDAVALYKRIVLIVSQGDSAEIRVKADGTLSLFKVRKEREEKRSPPEKQKHNKVTSRRLGRGKGH